MTTPNELRTTAQRLREYSRNPHHNNPTSEAFFKLVNEAAETLSSMANDDFDVPGAESRTAWIAVVLQKYPTAEIRVEGTSAIAAYSGIQVGTWLPGAWSVK